MAYRCLCRVLNTAQRCRTPQCDSAIEPVMLCTGATYSNILVFWVCSVIAIILHRSDEVLYPSCRQQKLQLRRCVNLAEQAPCMQWLLLYAAHHHQSIVKDCSVLPYYWVVCCVVKYQQICNPGLLTSILSASA